jgi:hypothetical protein
LCQFVLYHVGNCVNLYQFGEGFLLVNDMGTILYRGISKRETSFGEFLINSIHFIELIFCNSWARAHWAWVVPHSLHCHWHRELLHLLHRYLYGLEIDALKMLPLIAQIPMPLMSPCPIHVQPKVHIGWTMSNNWRYET